MAANLRVLTIDAIKSVPYAPVSHAFIDRLIGTVRREYLDHLCFWSAIDLTRKLDAFVDYYNRHRVHRSLDGATPANGPAHPYLLLPRLVVTPGGSIASVCSKQQLPPGWQFATYTREGERWGG